MKTILFTDDYEDAYSDSSVEQAARVFLTGKADETIRVSNAIFLDAARCLVKEEGYEPFVVRVGGKSYRVDQDGRYVDGEPSELCVLEGILARILAPKKST